MKIFAVAFLLFYAGILAWLSLTPVTETTVQIWDKALHAGAYCLFFLLGAHFRSYVAVPLLILAYSGLLEIAQSFVPGRDMSFLDFIANGIGVLIGMGLVWVWGKIRPYAEGNTP